MKVKTLLRRLGEGSLVLVAGKGHEAFQTIGDTAISFSDHEVLRSEAGRERCV